VITPINIALLGVVLAAVALVLLRRRRSGTTDETVSHEMPDEAMTTLDEPAAPVQDDVFSKHVWAEAAATLTPVREDEAVAVADADLDSDDDEAEPEDEAPDAVHEADDEPEDDADDLDAPEGEHDEETGEIQDLELEDMVDPDDGLREIITEPGWYLPGETDMTRGSPGAPSGSLIPQDDLVMSGGLPADEPDFVADAPSALAEDDNDFSADAGWASAVENGAEPAEPSWLGLADEEGAAAAAVEHETSFDAAPSPSDDLFALPALEEGIPENGFELGAPSPALDRWQDPVSTIAPLALAAAPAGITVAQHGPLTVSIDPTALVAMETEEITRSTSHGDGAVSWELTLKVELRRRENGTGTAD
jgi:hypothetical protein